MELQRSNGKIFCPLKNSWHVETPEEVVRQKYVIKLVDEYGYSLEQMAQELKVTNSHRGQGNARADIVVWKSAADKRANKKAFIVVECKAENIKIRQEDYYQGFNYASWAGATFFITTNDKETKFFNVNKDYLPQQLNEILSIPKASEANSDKKIKEILSMTKTFTRDEFTKLLFKCHTIIRDNDKLSPEASFDEISKILFMKIRYERSKNGAEVLTLEKYKEIQNAYNVYHQNAGTVNPMPFMQDLFEKTKEAFKEDNLFEPTETIKIRENSFERILKELQIYNLSDTSDDVKGIAFEQFLGKTFRGELGQFFTPRTIVDFMTSIVDPKEGETICDPTCGSGGFLIKSFEYVRENIEKDILNVKTTLRKELEGENYDSLSESEQIDINKKVDALNVILNKELDGLSEGSRLYYLSHNCIFGTDANPRMARTSKMNMIMHGDGHGGVHHHDGLLNVNGIFENRFDVILTNPPFGSRINKDLKITENDKFTNEAAIRKYLDIYGDAYREAMKQVDDHINTPIIDLFGVGKYSGLTEVLFIDRCLNLLKKGGRMGIVLPEGVLNNGNLQKARDYFEGRAKIVMICSIPQDVFIASGATVKPSLVFLKKFTAEEEEKYFEAKRIALESAKAERNEEVDSLEHQKADAQREKNKPLVKEINEKLKVINKEIIERAEQIVKKLFDYDVVVTKVQKAGITTTGAPCENELIDVLKEFKEYASSHELWKSNYESHEYRLVDGHLVKVSNGGEVIMDE